MTFGGRVGRSRHRDRNTKAAAAAPIPVPVGLPAVQIVLEHVPHLGVEEAVRKGYYEALFKKGQSV